MIATSTRDLTTSRSTEKVGRTAPSAGNEVAKATPIPVTAAKPAARQAMIAEAAYYLAEQRAFAPGHELEDWLYAESEIDRLLSQGGFASK